MGYWVYLARCGDNTIYTGATKDLKRRVREHNRGFSGGRGAKYTASHLPVTLVQAWEVVSWSDALRLEYAIKRCTRREKDQLIAHTGHIFDLAERRKFAFKISVVSAEILKGTDNPNAKPIDR
ncbi:MAG: GIY-YIG nuclease family protein [Bacillota bacterium]|nr:GIY-YIG nuclease family protein [Bacillota bacterium]MDP4160465.1 GIY-YIG nuclease family protein [Bacillota bacterium]